MSEIEIDLGRWAIRCFADSYSLWKNSTKESVIVEHYSSKIATIDLCLDGSLLVLSENAYYEINAVEQWVKVWSPEDSEVKVSV